METNGFHENKLVGNNAESIVEFLINSTPNWKCVKFGVENHMDDLKKLVVDKINTTTRKIKSMPDFVAFNEKTGETFFVEAKFRGFIDMRNGKSEYKLDFLKEYMENWQGTKLIVVHGHDPYFFVIDLNEVKPEMCRKDGNNYYWDFSSIQKGIKDLFPKLPEESLKRAIEMIPKR